MIARIDFVVDAHDKAVLVNQDTDAFGVTGLWVLASAIGQRQVGFAHLRVGRHQIYQRRESGIGIFAVRQQALNLKYQHPARLRLRIVQQALKYRLRLIHVVGHDHRIQIILRRFFRMRR